MKNLELKRIATLKGRTGTIVLDMRGNCVVEFDGDSPKKGAAFLQTDNLYFPQSPQGYNQPCFKNHE